MRRLPLVGFVVSGVVHAVAITLVVLVMARLTSLPGLFIDLTIAATEPGNPSSAAAPSSERTPSAAPPKRPGPVTPAGPRASAVSPPRARTPVTQPRAAEPPPTPIPASPRASSSKSSAPPEIPRPAAPPTIVSETPDAAPRDDAALPATTALSSVDVASSAGAVTSQVPPTGGTGAHSSESADSARATDGGPGGGGGGARAGQALAVATPGVSAGGPTGGGGAPAQYGEYLAHLRQLIQESLRYPLPARRRGLTGTVHLDVIIQPDGAIGSVTLAASSSHVALDEAALETVRGLRPMPFPKGVTPRPLHVRVPVVFELR